MLKIIYICATWPFVFTDAGTLWLIIFFSGLMAAVEVDMLPLKQLQEMIDNCSMSQTWDFLSA
eukprot:c39949_g1_i1 orf=83-271(+)